MMIAVILAGGYGTRMRDQCRSLPKPMLPIAGKPILQRQIEVLAKEGIKDFIIVAGYLHDQIVRFFKDGARFGVRIRYYIESSPMGTGGALKKLNLKNDFLLLNGDLLFDISLQPFIEFHFSKPALITVYAHPNSHPYDSVLINCDADTNEVVSCGRYTEEDYPNLCNSGIQMVSPAALAAAEEKDYLNYDRDILLPNIKNRQVYAYKNSECILDVGTPERLKTARDIFESGLLEKKKRCCLQKAIFLDRDGTINKYKGFISHFEEMELIPGVAEAIKTFHALGFLVVVITNQPVIARGLCSLEELQRIHNRMERLLGEEGAFIDDLFFCPHHPDAGFPNENKKYKIRCDCRKPSPGLLIKAKEKYNIDLRHSFMAGDSMVDVETAKNAGCKPVFLKRECQKEDIPDQTMCFNDLLGFSMYLSAQEGNGREFVD